MHRFDPLQSTALWCPALGTHKPIRWSDWPARRQPARAAIATAFIVFTVAWVATLDLWLAFVAALLLLTACAEVLLPTRFALSDSGVVADNPFRRATRTWDRFGSWFRTADGFRLVGGARSRILRRRASVTLRCSDRRDEVEEALRTHLGDETLPSPLGESVAREGASA